MPVEKQVVSIFAGTNGYLDAIPIEHVRRFERELLSMMELKHAAVLNEIADAKDLSPQLTEKLSAILKEFSGSFTAAAAA
jgi:F-type H+-transporting ATPase subunit alpha